MSNRTKLRSSPSGRTPAGSAAGVGPTWRKVGWLLVLAFAVGALLGGPIGALTADGGGSSFEDKVAELRAADAKRDAAQIVELTAKARRVLGELTPVLEEMAKAVPPGSAPGPTATADAVRKWQVVTKKAVEEFANPPSGGTAVNVARSGFAAAVRSLDLAVASYAAALELPEAQRVGAFTLAGKQRDAAVSTWSVAATQLDQINVDSGNGHQHVYLPAVPGQGALTPDGSKEGN